MLFQVGHCSKNPIQINKTQLQKYLTSKTHKQVCSITIYFLQTETGQEFKKDMYR